MGVDVPDKSYLQRLSWNRAISTNRYWVLPVDDKGYENFMPVGRGVPSNEWCGKYRGLLKCGNVEGHKGKVFKGQDCTNKVFVRLQHYWCKRSSCPVCFISGWSARRAKYVVARLSEGVKRGFGEVEHVVISVPKSDYDLFYEVLRRKALKALVARGVAGGCMIFHGFRIDRVRRVLAWSPHFHVLGFILGGYGKCRGCKVGDCFKCEGFEGRTRRENVKDGCIVRVLPERKTVYGSAWYQMNHSTIKIGIKRFHTISWFGNCGFRKFEASRSFSGVPCSVCGDEMCRGVHVGKRDIVKNLGHPAYVSSFVDDEFGVSGEPNYFGV